MNKILKFALLSLILMFSAWAMTGCDLQGGNQDTLLKQVRDRNKIIVGVKFDSKPFGFLDEKQHLQGFDVDLSREIVRRILGSPDAVEFKQVTASNRIFSLTSGSIDMVVATMTITPQRMQVVDFSEPYFTAGQAIMAPKKSRINTMKDLNGRRVVIVLGTTAEQSMRMLAPQAILQGFRTYTSGYTAVKSGRADAMTSDDALLQGFIMEDPSMKLLKKRYTEEPYGVAFRKDDDVKSFEDAVNLAIQDMKADGTIARLTRKWMKA